MGVLDRRGLLVSRFTSEVDVAEASEALKMLAGLKTRADGWQPKTLYVREALPLSWARIARLGMDVKDVTLARGMDPASRVFDSDGFTLRYGEGIDPYTGRRLVFEQVADVATRKIDLDHVVALSDAFTSGGHRWKRDGYSWMNLANDPGNLLAVSSSVNRSKGDRSAAGWLPSEGFRVRYVVMQIQVKTRYRLSVTEAEAETMRTVLGSV